MEQVNTKKLKMSKKVIVGIIIAVLIVAMTVVGIVFIKNGKNKNEEEIEKPLLPCGIEFGLSRDDALGIFPEMKEQLLTVKEDKVNKNFSHLINIKKSDFENFFGLKNALSDDKGAWIRFNSDEELYEFSFSLIIREDDNLNAEELIDYYSDWFDDDYKFDSEENQFIEFEDKKFFCQINYMPPIEGQDTATTLSITVTSKEYKPVYREVPESIINDAYNSYYYNVDSFKINLIELLNNCSENYSVTYDSYRNIRYSIPIDIINKIEADDFELSEYLSTAYYLSVNGPISENPEIPYLMTENKEIISFIVFFDDNNQVKGYYKVDECSELYTAAILTVF